LDTRSWGPQEIKRISGRRRRFFIKM